MKKFLSLQITMALLLPALLPHPAAAANIGDLIACPDFSTVYYLAEDGRRHPFPNENTFFSWYNDFHDVVTISCEDLAQITIGDTIVYQAGTRLVKLPSVPTVYVVEDGGVLRPLRNEAQAEALFGEDWAKRVDDLSEAFWPDFELGTELGDGEIPGGTILKDDEGELFRMKDGEAVQIDVVLDTDQEDNLEEHALDLDEVEDRLGVAIALLHVDAEQAVAVLQDVLEKLQAFDADHDNETELDEIDELEDDDVEDAADAIDDAQEEIAEAEGDIAEDAADGKDITASEELLEEASTHLSLAEAAYATGDFLSAEDHADEARHAAMWARGKAVDSVEEDEDLDEDDDIDDDKTADHEEDEDGGEDEVENNSDDHSGGSD